MVGVYIVDYLKRNSSIQSLILIELGHGRRTFVTDILNVINANIIDNIKC